MVLLFAGTALGQTVIQDGTSFRRQLQGAPKMNLVDADSTGRLDRSDASGNQYVREAFPIYSQTTQFENLINNAGLALGVADSNANPVDTRQVRLGMLLIKAWLAGTGTVDTTCVARIAIQIRTHLNNQADSASTFAIYRYGVVPAMQATAFAADTSQEGHLYSGVPITEILATPSANTAWSGEYTFLVSGKRNAHGNGFAINGHTYYYPNGMAIPLATLFGREVYSPYTSVRVRVMTFQKGAANLSTGTVGIAVHLIGTPL
jgi:hypothetical protein